MHTQFNIADALVPLFVISLIIIIGIIAVPRYFQQINQAVRWANRVGCHLRKYKDVVLEKWLAPIPISANLITLSRPVFICFGLRCFTHEQYLIATLLNTVGWFTDLLDGAKARADEKRTGRKSKYGGAFDVGVDIICFVATLIVLHTLYSSWLLIAFSAAIGLRLLLFLIYQFGRWLWGWSKFLPFIILPASFAGQFKTTFVAASIGLIIINPTGQTNLFWAGALLLIATALELCSLTELSLFVWRKIYRPQTTPLI